MKKVTTKDINDAEANFNENVGLTTVDEVYFLARLRDRIVMQEYSVIIENENSSPNSKKNNNKHK